jgi:hypothetical protein
VEYTINGAQPDVIYFADQLDDWIAAARQWYSAFFSSPSNPSVAGVFLAVLLFGVPIYILDRISKTFPVMLAKGTSISGTPDRCREQRCDSGCHYQRSLSFPLEDRTVLRGYGPLRSWDISSEPQLQSAVVPGLPSHQVRAQFPFVAVPQYLGIEWNRFC